MTSDTLTALSKTVGWLYFVAWSVSFYPQIILNYRRKAVSGLSFEFQAYNFTGFLFYAIYTCINYWLQERDHPDDDAFQINDIAFSVHAFLMTVVTCFQIFKYKTEHENINRWHVAILVCMWLGVLVNVILGSLKVIGWAGHPDSGYNYNVVEYLGYVKAVISAVKYTPQAYMNWKYKSTRGWSIGGVLLDLTGGTLSFTQQFIDSHNTASGEVDWSVFTGNVTKFLLAVESILFDLIFLVQHYILYRGAHDYEPHNELHVDASDSYRGILIGDADGYHTPESHSAAAHYRINQSNGKMGYDPHAGAAEDSRLLNNHVAPAN